jgi:stage II sporulation SpoE-like protein
MSIIVALGGLTVFIVARAMMTSLMTSYALITTLSLISVVLAFEGLQWYWARRALRKEYLPARWLTTTGIVLENSLPTVAMLVMLQTDQVDPPHQVLSAPVVMTYFLFLMTTSLRLTPAMSVVGALVAATGFYAVMLSVYLSAPPVESGTGMSTRLVHGTYGAVILVAGLLSAGLAWQVRKHVLVGIREYRSRRRLERDLELARSIQQDLLPESAPEFPGYLVDGQSHPADQTGGDHFDWLELPDGRLAVTIADVTGHGIGPALLAANLHAYVHAIFADGSNPQEWVTRLNRFLSADLKAARFVTFAVVVLDPNSGVATILSAGQGPILLYHAASGEVSELQAHGPPLGVVDGLEYPEPTEVCLQKSDAIALVTDGFFEWENPRGEQYGIDRLKASFQRHAAAPPAKAIDGLRDDVTAFSAGTPQADDLTAVLLRKA